MKTYSIETHEDYVCRYVVEANSPEEALAIFRDGGADEASSPEFNMIISYDNPVEIDDDSDD
jgi:hypothetical protein